MIKGIYKEFITMKIKSNPLYEEAIFILKCEPSTKSVNKKAQKKDLIFEANRILCEQDIKKPRKRLKIVKKILFAAILLLLGGVSGALITFLLLY